MTLGWVQILIVAVLIVLLFGRGKISGVMGDVAKGIKSFKKGMADETDVSDDTKALGNSQSVKSQKIKSTAKS